MGEERIKALKKEIEDLKQRWPAHSIPPAMLEQLDDLEEQLDREIRLSDGPSMEINAAALQVQAIGRVENEFDQPTAPDQIRMEESRVVIDPDLVEGLQGLEAGQQIMVVFYFDRSEGFDLLQHPRGDQNRPRRGVFALRSPRRPNPIGVTVVELLGIEGNVLRVRGLDAIDGTPVLDLKPA